MKHVTVLLLAVLCLAANGFAQVGTGPSFVNPFAIAVEADGNMVVADYGHRAVIRVDAATGNRAFLSGQGAGSGPNFSSLTGIAVEANGQIVVSARGVFRIDPVTGNRTIVSNASTGTGPSFSLTETIAIEADGNLVVADDGPSVIAVFRVDPVNGNRTIISGAGSGSGPGFVGPSGVAVEADGNLVVADWDANAVFRVDPVTGNRTILSDASTGSGPAFGDPLVLAVEADGNIVVADGIVVSGGVNAVIRVDPVTGDRTIVSDANTGSGPALGSPGAIAVAADGSLLVASDGIAGVFRIDPVTGDRAFVSGGTTAVEDKSGRLEIPQDFALQQNYPNPFSATMRGIFDNPSTVISFQLPVSSEVELAVYNSSGQLVRTLSQGQMTSGTHSVVWDGTNDNGARVASGVYLYTLTAGEVTLQRKLVLMK